MPVHCLGIFVLHFWIFVGYNCTRGQFASVSNSRSFMAWVQAALGTASNQWDWLTPAALTERACCKSHWTMGISADRD